jgi:hypothetical protein
METKESEKINPVFEIDALVKETFNSIAEWHNDEASSASLKQLALELVEKISTATLKHVGLNGNLSVYKDEETAKKIEKIRKDKAI